MPEQTEIARRRKVNRRLTFVILGANFVGAFLSLFFFNLQVGSVSTGVMGTNLVVVIGLIVLGNVFGTLHQRPLESWYLDARSRAPSSRVQRLALNLPLLNAGISFSMWFLAGFINALMSLAFGGSIEAVWQSALSIFISLAGIAGSITAVLVYFASERIWRSEIPLFFPKRQPSDVAAFSLSLRQRLMIPLVLSVILMMLMAVLATLAWREGRRLTTLADVRVLFRTLRNQELFLFGIGVLVVAGLSATLGRDMVDMIATLRAAMQKVQAGDLHTQVSVTSNDELGDLAAGFNTMVDGLRKEEMIRKLFGRYVTPQVAEHAIAHGAKLGGQQIVATVLFSDIRGFTALTERLPPEVLIALLNRYFEAMSAVISQHGGLINKFGGDSLLAIFGAPLNPIDHQADAALCAAEGLLETLEVFNKAQRSRGEPTLRIGIGVASGPVVAGNVGSRARMEYTVIGDTVNLASRLESLTKEHPTEVLIDQETARCASSSILLQPLGEIEVRGKDAPVAIYTLAGKVR